VALGLHACGSATDHALLQAVKQRAAFIVSPCCVGKLKRSLAGLDPRPHPRATAAGADAAGEPAPEIGGASRAALLLPSQAEEHMEASCITVGTGEKCQLSPVVTWKHGMLPCERMASDDLPGSVQRVD
jgi:hypothetical protein